jgi:hypothetical protein
MTVGENTFPLGNSQPHLTGKSPHIQLTNLINAPQAHDDFQVSRHAESTRNAHTDPRGIFMYGYGDLPNNLPIHD